jgi:hypothetical protein
MHLISAFEPSMKRIRYGYYGGDDVDIDALQAQAEDEDMVDANAFFQIIREG